MQVKIVFYGGLRYELGRREHVLEWDAAEATVAEVVARLTEAFPQLEARLDKVALAVGDEIVGRQQIVSDGDEVSLLPPVSGGSGDDPSKWISEAPLDLDALLRETADPACGGLVIFSGDIRNHNDGKRVTGITYDAHASMAAKVLRQIEAEVLERFDVNRCRIQHRVGHVAVGESSVLVVVRAAHRAAAFEGASYGIDELKVRTPIWKEEHYEDGESRFLDGIPLQTKVDE